MKKLKRHIYVAFDLKKRNFEKRLKFIDYGLEGQNHFNCRRRGL